MKKIATVLFVLLAWQGLQAQRWVAITSGTTGDIWGIDWVNSSVVWICAANGDVKRSTDGGNTFTAAGNAGEGAYSVAALDASTAVVALGPSSGDGKIMRTTNAGTTWTQVYTTAGAWFNFIDNVNATTLWALSDPIGGNFHIVKSTDAGLTWALASNLPAQPATSVFGANSGFYRIGGTAWFGTGGSGATLANRVYKSATAPDGPWAFGTTTAQYPGALAFSSASGAGVTGFWSVTSNQINVSADGGATWTVKSPAIGNVRGLDYVQGSTWVWAATSTGIWKSSDNGNNWVADTAIAAGMYWLRFYGDANVGLCGGVGGALYKSRLPAVLPVELTSFTAGLTGTSVSLNWATATEINNQGFEVERRLVNAGSVGEWAVIGYKPGFGTVTEPKQYSFVDNVEGISATRIEYRLKQIDFGGQYNYSDGVLVDNVQPVSFNMEQNFPNPFNPSTAISFSLPADNVVALKVFNSLGQEVAVLVNGPVAAGNHSVNFDAAGYTSGTYYAVLRAGEMSKSIKMILMK